MGISTVVPLRSVWQMTVIQSKEKSYICFERADIHYSDVKISAMASPITGLCEENPPVTGGPPSQKDQ